jgi:hypothetical protein
MPLQEDALSLAELDRRIIRDLVENNIDDLGIAVKAYLELRVDIKKRILDKPTSTIEDQTAADVLRKILGGDGLPSDRIIERLGRLSDEEYIIDAFTEDEIEHLGYEVFYTWFSHSEYIRGLEELRPLILRHPVPEFVSRLVRQVRNCYAFQQYDATYGLCRTLIEACVRDICVRQKLFPDLADNVILFEKYQWGKLRDKVASGLVGERLKNHYSELSTLVHGRKTVTQEEARNAFKVTLKIIEALYVLNGI